MTTDPDGRALLAGIRANPDDAARWGVAADWFRERGLVAEADVLARREDLFGLARFRVANDGHLPVVVYVLAGGHTLWMSAAVGAAYTNECKLPPGIFGRAVKLPVAIDVRTPDPRWASMYPQTREDWVSCGQVRLGGPWGWGWGSARFAPRRPLLARLDPRDLVFGPWGLVTVEWQSYPPRVFDNWGTD